MDIIIKILTSAILHLYCSFSFKNFNDILAFSFNATLNFSPIDFVFKYENYMYKYFLFYNYILYISIQFYLILSYLHLFLHEFS